MKMGIKIKKFNNYNDYLTLQTSKAPHGSPLKKMLLPGGNLWESTCNGFEKHFNLHKNIIKNSSNALCLGARTGPEVHVLKEMGVDDAIGIDLVDAPPLVIKGDVHELQFKDNTFDLIFSNIFDHVLYPAKFISEIERVSKPGAYCILHLVPGHKMTARGGGDGFAANELSDTQIIIELFNKDINIIKNEPLNQPDWINFWELVIKIK